MTEYSDRLRKQLMIDEGEIRIPGTDPNRPHSAYKDDKQIWTTGYGLNLEDKNAAKELKAVTTKTKEDIIAHKAFLTEEEALKLLDNRIAVATSDARKLVSNFDQLDDPRKLVVAAMAYQMGYKRFGKFKATIKAVGDKDFKAAAGHMRDSRWGRGSTGRRAGIMAAAMETGKYPEIQQRRTPHRKRGARTGKARLIPTDNLGRMVTQALDLERQRDLTDEWGRLLSRTSPETIALSEFWWMAYRQQQQNIRDEQARKQLEAFTQRMETLQAHANGLYVQYQQTLREMADAQKTLGTLHTISSILGIVKGAISVGQMIGESNKPPVQTATPEASTPARISVVSERTVRVGQYSETRRFEINGDFKNIEELQQQIHDHYRTLGIPLGIIPAPPRQLPLKRP